MMFHQYPTTDSLDTPPQLSGLYGLQDFGIVWAPFLIAGASAAVTAVIATWLGQQWDVGTYNAISQRIDDTLHLWDQQGWTTGCWAKNPAKRTEWLAFWKRWSRHYGEYGTQHVYLSQEAEAPVRNIFLPELDRWGVWFNTECKIQTGTIQPSEPEPAPAATSFENIVKWGAVATGLLAIASLFRSAGDLLQRDR